MGSAPSGATGAFPGANVTMPERYDLLDELGRGGMGVVYKVRDRETGEVLALKFLKSEIASDQQIMERFKNELRLAHRITHRNVARLYEFHRAGDAAYLSMEFVEGQSLRSVMQAEGKMEPARAYEIARQLGAGLSEAHRQSIAHRDLKPENVMLTSDGDVKVMDFGISRSFASGATVTGAIIGTPAYMSPEQAEGRPADHRADIYAFGLMLYEMYTGVQAFTGETPVSVALKQIRERPEAPRKLDPGLPKHIEQAILRCLEKDPAKRFQSVDEVIAALGGTAAAGKTVVLAPRTGSRVRLWVIAAASVAVLAAGAMWFLWWRGHSSDEINLHMQRFTLANGLQVVLSLDHATPTFTLALSYKTGARADPPGREGLSHLVSHLMFQGSPNVAAGEHLSLIQSLGGIPLDVNYADSDLFAASLPSNQLELALYLEADRMRSLEITPAGLDEARTTLIEEQRTRIDNSPYGLANVLLHEMAFDNPVNRRTGYGNLEVLKSITAEEANRFHQTYYTPSNAALALVGDFDPANARARIEHYFGSIPKRPAPPPADIREPGRSAEARRTTTSALAQAPLLMLAWRTPSPSDPDWFPLRAVMNLLGGNEASRLQTALVKSSGVASAIQVLQEDNSGLNLLMLNIVAAPGKDLAQVESRAHQEIERIAKEGISDAEMERMFIGHARSRALSLITTTARGAAMSRLLGSHGYPEGLNEWSKELRKVNSESLRRVIAKYFTPANRSVLYVYPAGAEPR